MIQIINAVLYGGLAIAGIVFWRHRRTRASAWLAATFGVLGIIVVQAQIVPPAMTGESAGRLSPRELYTDLLIAGLLSTPWLLLRFVRSLRRQRTAADVAADVGMGLIVAATFAIPGLPDDAGSGSAWANAYYLFAVAWWCVLLAAVTVLLWQAGRGQSGVVRRRMTLMAIGALMINGALLAPALSGDANTPGSVVELVTAGLSWSGAIGFWLGVKPPHALRRMWRREDEVALGEADAALVRAQTREAAAEAVVHAAVGLVGGSGARIEDADGHVLASVGQVRDGSATNLRVEGDASAVTVAPSPYLPVFGRDEEALLLQLCRHLDLALHRISAYEASEAARLQTEQANDDLQQLVYGISHDLRNPLVTILGFLDLLQTDADQLSDQGRLALDRIGASAAYMDNLIQDLLQLSRIGRADSEAAVVDLGPMVTEIAADVAARHDGVQVDVTADARVWMNPVRAQQLFTNLLENAARHGGRRPLAVVVRSADGGPDRVTVDVSDDGVGIPPADRQRVFAIFQRLEGFDAGSPGSGIGLTMCQRIAEDAGGSIGVADASVGTTIRLSLPLPPDETPPRDNLDRLQPTGVPTT